MNRDSLMNKFSCKNRFTPPTREGRARRWSLATSPSTQRRGTTVRGCFSISISTLLQYIHIVRKGAKSIVILRKFDASVSLSGDDVSAVSVDSMVLVMAGLMLALLIVLLVVALFLHRRHQVQSALVCSFPFNIFEHTNIIVTLLPTSHLVHTSHFSMLPFVQASLFRAHQQRHSRHQHQGGSDRHRRLPQRSC